jgi:hypothetical protein
MILETAQILSTAVRTMGIDNPKLYKATHKNHPSSVWARANRSNFAWCLKLGYGLCAEYFVRYGKCHKSMAVLDEVAKYVENCPSGEFYDPPQCMPDECKDLDTVIAYKKYYCMKKQDFATWKTIVPNWFNDGVNK